VVADHDDVSVIIGGSSWRSGFLMPGRWQVRFGVTHDLQDRPSFFARQVPGTCVIGRQSREKPRVDSVTHVGW
jgi:hypothetical protein